MNTLRAALILHALVAVAAAAEPMSAAAMPAYGGWRSCLIGGGGWIQEVLFTADPRRLYAYVDVGGAWRSDDGGRSWRSLQRALPLEGDANCVRSVAPDPRDADRVLLACGSDWKPPLGVFASRDGGATFARTLTARFAGNAEFRQAGQVIARDPRDPDRVWAGSLGDGVFRSTDGGATWSTAAPETVGLDVTDLRVDERDPRRLWACAQPLPHDGHEPYAGGFWRSEDAGATWRRLAESGPTEIRERAGRLYGLFPVAPAVRISDDRGESWRDASAGLAIGEPASLRAIAELPDGIVLADQHGGVWRGDGGGWTRTPLRAVDYRGWAIAERTDIRPIFASDASSLSVDPRDPAHWFLTDAFAIYETRDGGATWATAMDGIECTIVHALCQDPSDPGRLHLGMGDDGGFTSDDGGASFRIRELCSNVKDIAVSRARPERVLAVGTGAWEWRSNQVFASCDDGATWSRSPMIGLPDMVHAECNTIAVAPDDADDCLLAVSGALAAGAGGPYRSADGGKSWRWWGEGLPAGVPFFPSSIWISGRQAALGVVGVAACVGAGRVFLRDRDAASWSAVDDVVGASCVVADPHRRGGWLVAGDGGVWRVDDGRARRVVERPSHQLAVDAAVAGRFAAAVGDAVLLSTDGGEHWTALDDALPAHVDSAPLAFAGDRLLVAPGGFGAFWLPLLPVGEPPVRATPRPARPMRPPGEPPALRDLGFATLGEPGSPWTLPPAADARAERDGGAPVARLVVARAGADVALRQDLPPTFDEFALSGWCDGGAAVAVQVFDDAWRQIAWLRVAEAPPDGALRAFRTRLTLPGRAAHASLVLRVAAGDHAAFGDLAVAATPPAFR